MISRAPAISRTTPAPGYRASSTVGKLTEQGPLSDLRFTLYQAAGATHQGEPPDPSESTRVEWVPVADLRKLIDKGQLTDGPSLMGLSVAVAFPPPAE
jgi:hypothetical protein